MAIISKNSWRMDEWKRVNILFFRRAKGELRELQISLSLFSIPDKMKEQFIKQRVEVP